MKKEIAVELQRQGVTLAPPNPLKQVKEGYGKDAEDKRAYNRNIKLFNEQILSIPQKLGEAKGQAVMDAYTTIFREELAKNTSGSWMSRLSIAAASCKVRAVEWIKNLVGRETTAPQASVSQLSMERPVAPDSLTMNEHRTVIHASDGYNPLKPQDKQPESSKPDRAIPPEPTKPDFSALLEAQRLYAEYRFNASRKNAYIYALREIRPQRCRKHQNRLKAEH